MNVQCMCLNVSWVDCRKFVRKSMCARVCVCVYATTLPPDLAPFSLFRSFSCAHAFSAAVVAVVAVAAVAVAAVAVVAVAASLLPFSRAEREEIGMGMESKRKKVGTEGENELQAQA